MGSAHGLQPMADGLRRRRREAGGRREAGEKQVAAGGGSLQLVESAHVAGGHVGHIEAEEKLRLRLVARPVGRLLACMCMCKCVRACVPARLRVPPGQGCLPPRPAPPEHRAKAAACARRTAAVVPRRVPRSRRCYLWTCCGAATRWANSCIGSARKQTERRGSATLESSWIWPRALARCTW